MTAPQHLQHPLLADVRQLIDAARQRVAQAVNAELTQLHWKIGRRISAEILHTLCAQLSWSHLRLVIQIDDSLKRDFYLEICRVEHWSVRQLQERINSLLFERTAISKKPEETIRQDLDLLRDYLTLFPPRETLYGSTLHSKNLVRTR